MAGSALQLAQRAMLRTARTPLRHVWAMAYAATTRALAAYLGRSRPGAAVYVCGSLGAGEPAYGSSDIDLVVTVPDGDPSGTQRAAVQERWSRLKRRLSVLDSLVDLSVYEESALREAVAATTMTFGLGEARSLYFGPRASAGSVALHEGPGLYGPTEGWRLVAGPERRPAAVERAADEELTGAWLQLQSWWRWAFLACAQPERPWVRQHSAKLVSEPLRILLWLRERERLPGRTDLLRRAASAAPEHGEAIDWALEQLRARSVPGPEALARALPWFVELSQEIAVVFCERAGEGEEVALAAEEDELPPPPALPLADWAARVFPWFTDETLSPRDADPGDPLALAAACTASSGWSYSALRAGPLLVLPTAQTASGRGRLRAAQCAATDPVSFGLLEGSPVARFPVLRGWSARDSAARAVAEHAACLRYDAARVERDSLSKAFNAARASLFWESLDARRPELPLTVAATAHMLGPAADEIHAEYVRSREQRRVPEESAVRELLEIVRELPAYRG
jgi:predicted nucleotidyltransferase